MHNVWGLYTEELLPNPRSNVHVRTKPSQKSPACNFRTIFSSPSSQLYRGSISASWCFSLLHQSRLLVYRMFRFISTVVGGIHCIFLLVHSRLDCLASDFATLEERRYHVAKAVRIAMGRMGGRRTLQTYTRGVLETNSCYFIRNFVNFSVKSFM